MSIATVTIPRPLARDVVDVVAAHYGLPAANVARFGLRPPRIVLARHIAVWLTWRIGARSYSYIARTFDPPRIANHTSIMHAVHRISAMVKTDERFAATLAQLEADIRQWRRIA